MIAKIIAAIVLFSPVSRLKSTVAESEIISALRTTASRCGYRLHSGDGSRALKIAKPESGLRRWVINKRSKAMGLFQLKPSTWKHTGTPISKETYRQVEAFLKYIIERYGTLEKAYAFRRKHGWY